jgi:transcriptional regulator with XRE-family HTH domain
MCKGLGVLLVAASPPPSVTADRLQQAIDAKGFTQTEVAQAVGRTQTAISYWVNAKRRPDLDDLFALAGVLEVEVAWLLGIDAVAA